MALEIVTDPKKYFQELVFAALKNQNIEASPATELYLVELMGKFMVTDDNLFGSPLAFIMMEAVEETNPGAKRTLFKNTGDLSLYTAGIFGESLSKKIVGVSYYIDMGALAYKTVASMTAGYGSHMFLELSTKIEKFVSVLAEVSESTSDKTTHSTILKQYEIWMNTGSKRAEKVLKKSGIVPDKKKIRKK